jgi:hypothetical protein
MTTTLIILERIAAAEDLLSEVASKSDFRIFKELEESHYITGHIGTETMREAKYSITQVGFTTEGRLLMERLQREKKEKGFWAITWRWVGPVIGFIAGCLSPLLTDLLRTFAK